MTAKSPAPGFLSRVARRAARALGEPAYADVDWRALPGGAPATVIDIGANEGQYARSIRRALPDAIVHSFEPLSGPFATLAAHAARDSRHEAHRLALSDRHGTATIHTGPRTAASSLLPPGAGLRENYPELELSENEQVDVTTLDIWAANKVLSPPILIKLDIQGSELDAIRGGAEVIRRATAVWVELSFVEIYSGQPLFVDIALGLRQLGFDLASIRNLTRAADGFHDLQCDALFLPGDRRS